MIVAIHQPDFMPWLGFFRKLARADTWIVLDHVLNSTRDAAFWGRRVQLLVNGSPHWLSVPLEKTPSGGHGGIPISRMRIQLTDQQVFDNRLQTVREAYAKSRYFLEYFYLVEDYFGSSEPSLVRRNMGFTSAVLSLLRLSPTVVYSSDMASRGVGTDLLVSLIREVGGSEYVSGTGSAGYLNPASFKANGIALSFNHFEHPTYPQRLAKTFVPGLSIVDALFSVGADQVSRWVRG